MRKDQDLSSTDYVKHSRNSSRGKAGVNRVKRRNAKQSVISDNMDESPPKAKKEKKRFGVSFGKGYTCWYKTEKARDKAYDSAIKSKRIWMQLFGDKFTKSRYGREITKIER